MKWQRTPLLLLAVATLATACGATGDNDGSTQKTSIPAAIHCQDAAALQRQGDAREKVASKDDNYNGLLNSRAEGIFWNAAAIAATLKCRTQSPAADALLAQALKEAHKGQSSGDYRAATDHWSQGTIKIQQAIKRLLAQA